MHSAEIEIICPSCQNIGETTGKFKPKKCFYNAAKNLWHCYHCGSRGTGDPTMQNKVIHFPSNQEFQFTEELLKAYQQALEESEIGRDYLRKRLGGDHWQQFELGFDPGREAIVIPIRNLDKELIAVKYRFLFKTDPKYIGEPGSKAGIYFLKGNETKLLITEGEFDAMAARSMGFEGDIIAVQTNRINNASKEKICSLSEKAQIVYVAGDADAPGAELFPSLVDAGIPTHKLAEITKYPTGIKDVGEFAELNLAKEFLELINSAKTDIEKLSFSPLDRLQETIDFLSNKQVMTAHSTGFRMLDEKLGGGFIPHTLTGISAPGKTGKTSFIINLIHNLLIQNKKVGFISLEMSPTMHVLPNLLNIALKVNVRRMDAEPLINLIERDVEHLQPLKNLVFMDKYGTTDSDLIESWIRYQAAQGVQVFFFDHVGYSLKDIKDPAEHSKLSKTLRKLTREFPINICAVVQPKNLQFGAQRVTKHDLYGSVTWNQDLNELITLERSGDNQLSVRLTDSHNPLARPSDEAVLLFYDPATCSLRE